MKKIFLFLIVIALTVATFFYVQKPDLVIQNITAIEQANICKYTVEIKNKGFAPVNDIVSYCFWEEGQEKCKAAWDVINRNPETGITKPLVLNSRQTYKFDTSGESSARFGGTCPSVLNFCIDCGLRTEYDREIVSGSIKELMESNNDYTYRK